MNLKRDIETEADIKLLVDAFYDEVMKNKTLSPFFSHINFETHKPRMIGFWCFAILDVPGYTTNLFEVHKKLPLESTHFETWLTLFNETLSRLFTGPNTAKAIQKARTIGISMESKIGVK
jgi:hemoglobin